MLQFQISAAPIMKMEIVLNASKDTTLRKENVFSLNLTMLSLQISAVVHGIGIIKFA